MKKGGIFQRIERKKKKKEEEKKANNKDVSTLLYKTLRISSDLYRNPG